MHELRNFSDDEQRLLPADDYTFPSKQSHATARPLPAGHGPVQVGTPGRRYWFRSLVLILCPLIIVGYFVVICYWLNPEGGDGAVNFGRHGGRWVFYSWFLIGVIGLDLSRYGLLGAEAAMLERAPWEVPNLVALLQHSNNTWSSPSGWGRFFARMFLRKRRDTHRLWIILASLSIVFFVALPISGLAIEQADGYIYTSGRPTVVGRQWQDFNARDRTHYYPSAKTAWEVGSPPSLPGFGVLHTPKGLVREEYDGLEKVPNTLPLNESMPEMFLAPQAENPVGDKAWGLRASYRCEIIDNVDDFVLLNPQVTPDVWKDWRPHPETGYSKVTQRGRGIFDYYDRAGNILAYGQVAFGQKWAVYNGSEVDYYTPDDLDKGDLLEYALWQYRLKASYEEIENFDNDLDPIVKGLDGSPIFYAKNGSLIPNTTFFGALSKIQNNMSDTKGLFGDHGPFNQSIFYNITEFASPIGVQCRMMSTLGYAKLDPWDSTFNSFEPMSDPLFHYNLSVNRMPTLGAMAATTLHTGRFANIFSSLNHPAAIIQSNSHAYDGYIKPMDLKRTVMRAYATDLLQLMYDGKYGFEGGWLHPNLTATEEAKVLTPGEFPILVPILMVMFGYWALGCLVLGILYGFRPRQNETMDGYAYFRLSTDLADDVKPLVGALMKSKPDEIDGLWNVPGSIVRRAR
ncbi:hypothetical protein CDV31_004756 [Fusarium ambrosium]|uniref:Uncharacterized protein n=1 Tax=Fusarium ambrosium TaxID=131363 RepID=A0A428UNF0_9HYPO|nr:hypothetical protein CDV31_004756 [Fusarium ambrosium]